MASRAVHWGDGMFLRAQHFQTAERHAFHSGARRHAWTTPFGWGVRELDVDADALANYKLVVRKLKAHLRDGTMVAVPDDGTLNALDLRAAFQRTPTPTAYLAVPALDLSKPNAAPREAGGPVRYLTDTQAVADENVGAEGEPIHLRSLNVRLLLSTDDHTGYDVLPLARLTQAGQKAGGPELDPGYYPPLLTAEGWPPFARLVETVGDLVGRKADRLAAQLSARAGRGPASEWAANAAAQLQALNAAAAVIVVLGSTPGVSPLVLYTELCRMVGQLAAFGPTRTVPDLPRYDHEDLGPRVSRIKLLLDGLLGAVVEPDCKERKFVGVGLHLEAGLDPAWGGNEWRLFVGVQGSLPEAELRTLLADGGRFGLKVGSGTRVDELYRLGVPGLNLTPAERPDRLPAVPGEVLLAVERDAREWEHVAASHSLGLRFNDALVVGSLVNERVVRIRVGAAVATLTFTLYALAAWAGTAPAGGSPA